MNCCDDFGNCTQGANCAARASALLHPHNPPKAEAPRPVQLHLHTSNGGAQVDTRRRHSDMPIVDLGSDELFHADCWMGICARSITFLVVFLAALAAGCWWFRVPAFLWR